MKRRYPIVLAVLLLAALSLVLLRKSDQLSQIQRSRLQLGTVVEITAFGPENITEEAVRAAFDEIDRIEAMMSSHRVDSEVSHFNRATQSASLSAETQDVLRAGIRYSRLSDGAFDPTLGNLVRLWGFDSDRQEVPESAAIEGALKMSGEEAVLFEDGLAVKRSPGVQLDLGGIAKGFAVDRAIEVLRQGGVQAASVNAGGDIRLLGQRPDRLWRVALQHPRKRDGLLGTLELENVAVVTSGDYERFFEVEGERYHHLLDPRTGYPGRLCQGVTVVAETALAADALATAAFILGPDAGIDLLEKQGVDGVIVDADGEIHATAGFREQVTWH